MNLTCCLRLAATGMLLAAGVVYCQTEAVPLRPRIGVIDFYGVHKVSIERLKKALGAKEGDPLPGNKLETELRLNEVPGVVGAWVQAACCENGKAILYVGIEEKGVSHFEYHAEPEGNGPALPDEVTTAYYKFLEEVANAAQNGLAAEDLTQGHSLMQDATVRDLQLGFVEFADKYNEQLHAAVRKSPDAETRAIAAYLLGYAKDKNTVVDDLTYAMRDPDETVRSNAIRALGAIAVKARLDPEANIRIPATWFIEMLNSLVWTDRNYAASALTSLTEARNQKVLEQIRERALDSLLEMARWKHAEHAVPAYILLGRAAGIPESELQDGWKDGKRDEIIARAMVNVKAKKK